MRFVDRVRILVRAGDGGRGHVGWRREKYVPNGGPAGGDGGRGGDVVFVADESLTTLLDLRYRQHYQAEHGKPGRNKQQNGPGGADLRIRVPVGTTAYLEAVAGEPGERPPWLDARADEEEDEGGFETIYVFDDELDDGDDDDESEPDDESGSDDESESDDESGSDDESESDEAAVGEAAAGADGSDEAPREIEAAADDAASAEESGDASNDDADEASADDADDADDADGGGQDDRAPVAERPLGKHARELPEVADLVDDGQEVIVARGGRGGRGNVHFRSSTNRAPQRAEPGQAGEGYWLRLELKLLADVGIVGFPNVGKSTLIRRISRARPKVGAYPFTTLIPQLGVVSLSGERSMVVADVPGLIRGASEGKGLGLDFLRHLERTRVLLHLLAPDPGEGREPLADLDALEEELAAYGSIFDGKPRVVALNKIDSDEGAALIDRVRRHLRRQRIPLFPISAVTGEGVPELLEALYRRVALSRERDSARTRAEAG